MFAAPNNNGSPPQPLMKEDGEFMEMMEQRMRERINTMNSACNSKRKEICKLPEMTFPGSLYNRNFNVRFLVDRPFADKVFKTLNTCAN